jgi:hypothetical protein
MPPMLWTMATTTMTSCPLICWPKCPTRPPRSFVRCIRGYTSTSCEPSSKFRTLPSWIHEYKLQAVIDTFYVLKDDVAGQTKYNVPAYQLRRWHDHIEQLNIDHEDFGVGRNFQSSTERKMLRKKKIGNGPSGKHLDETHDKLYKCFLERTKTSAILNCTVLARKLYDLMNPTKGRADGARVEQSSLSS